MMILIDILLIAAGTVLAVVLYWRSRHPELRWDWSTIRPKEARFPDGFLWGVATSSHQVEGGCDNNNWSEWEQATDPDGRPRIHGGDVSGAACDHWNRYEEDIGLMQRLGVKAYRFSVEWSKIEPEPGHFDEESLAHYERVCDALLARGIQPVVTLHHFTHPLWFERQGAFERIENLDAFVTFSKVVFERLRSRVHLWCTINEPAVFALIGYVLGLFPPGRHDPQAAFEVLAHLMEAHTRVYHTLKELPGGKEARIGLVKNIFQFDPWNRWSPLDWALCRVLDHGYNGCILTYLRTGTFRFHLPGVVRVTHRNALGRGSTDFLGLNYYSHVNLKLRLRGKEWYEQKYRDGEVPTDMPYAGYPEGFYRALGSAASLGVPLYVTENGIADARDDRRATFIEQYLHALARAIQEGCPVHGYFYWSLLDNFEWAEGYSMRFGLYEVDFETQERTLRAGAGPFLRATGKTP